MSTAADMCWLCICVPMPKPESVASNDVPLDEDSYDWTEDEGDAEATSPWTNATVSLNCNERLDC